MKRGNKLLLLLLALVVAVGAYLLVTRLTPDEGDGSVAGTTLVKVSENDIKSISWVQGDTEASFERVGDIWSNTADREFPLSQGSGEKLVSAVDEVVSTRSFGGVTDFAQYGLEEPAMTVTVGYDDGTENTYALGNQNTVTSEYYMRLDNSGDVHLIGSDMYSAFSVSLMDMVQTEDIPAFGDPLSLTVQAGGNTLELEYFEDGGSLAYSSFFHWFIKNGNEYRAADTNTIQTFMTDLTSMEWAEVVSYRADDEELAAYGLDKPAAVLTVKYMEEDLKKSFVLELGDYSGKQCYAHLPGSKLVYLISADMADSIVKMDESSILPDEVCDMNMEELTRLDIRLGGETYSIEIGGNAEGDRTYTQGGNALDGETYDKLIDAVKALRSTEYADAGGSVRDELIGFTFYRDAGAFSEISLAFYPYDSGSCLAVLSGESGKLVSRDKVDELVGFANTLLGLS
jgi:hypothetical protein